MSKLLRPALSAALVVVASAVVAIIPVTAAPGKPGGKAYTQAQRDDQAPTDRFIVAFKKNAVEQRNTVARDSKFAALGKKLGVTVSHGRRLGSGAELIRTSRRLDRADAKRLLLELQRDPSVAYVEVDRVHRPNFAPNDPLLPKQTYLLKNSGGIGMDYAWQRGRGDGVVVAVLDTGITAHPDLDANVIPGYDFITDIGNGNDGDGRDADPTDPGDWTQSSADCSPWMLRETSTWHGTAVAGAIAASANNGIGLVGAAPGVKLLPVRVLGRCGGYTSDIADAITWAAGGSVAGVPSNSNPAEVINASFSTGGTCSATLQSAIDAANAAGAVVVSSIGPGETPSNVSPASCEGVIGVSVGRAYRRDTTYRTGLAVDILGPGGELPFAPQPPDFVAVAAPIQVTTNTGATTAGAPGYGEATGSSMAAAITSGTVAIMQQLRPQSPATVAAVLRQTAVRQESLTTSTLPLVPILEADAATHAVTTPTLVFDEWKYVVEGSGGGTQTATVTATLTEPLTTPVTFKVATVDGTATAGIDYAAFAPTLFTLAPGQTSKAVTVNIVMDNLAEDVEFFELAISDVTGANAITRRVRISLSSDDANWLAPNWIQYADMYDYNRYEMVVPEGATDVRVWTEVEHPDSYGDADLYVQKDHPPELWDYSCASTSGLLEESCIVTDGPGRYYVWVTTPYYFEPYIRVRASWKEPSQVSISDATFTEGDDGEVLATFYVSRSEANLGNVTFDYDTASGSATSGVDFTPAEHVPGVIGQSQLKTKVTVLLNPDTVVEPNETFTVTLSNVQGGTVVDGTATGTLLNDDGPTLSVSDAAVTEGQSGTKTATVGITLSEASASPVTFTATAVGVTAAAGSDFVAATQAITIPAGQTTASFSVTINGDTTVEATETLRVDLANASVSVQRPGTITIRNDDGPAISVGDVTVSEGNAGLKVATFTVQLAAAAAYPVDYTISTQAGTATAGVDYLEQVKVATIPAGMLAQTFHVAIKGDLSEEANETFQVVLSDVFGATVGDGAAVGTITNEDYAKLSVSDASVIEGNSGVKYAVFTVSISEPVNRVVKFDIATTANPNATATAGVDYVAATHAGVQIPAGTTSRLVYIAVNGDTTPENNEVFVVALANPVGAAILDGAAVGTITNDDAVPSLSVADSSIIEGPHGTKQAVFTVSLSNPAPAPVTFKAATAAGKGNATPGVDYQALAPTTFTVPVGQSAATVTVPIFGDQEMEQTEYFVVALSDVAAATVLRGTALGTIIDDDKPSVSITDASRMEGDGGQAPMAFEVTLSSFSPFPVTVDVATSGAAAATATAGTDYVALATTRVTFASGEQSKIVNVSVRGDTVAEANEVFVVALSNATNATIADGAALGTILDDEHFPSMSVSDATVTEGWIYGKSMVFTVTLSKPAVAPVTFTASTVPGKGTATVWSDYYPMEAQSFTIPAGQSALTFSVYVQGDEIHEPNETFVLALGGVTGAKVADGNALATIIDDDAEFSVEDAGWVEGNDGLVAQAFDVYVYGYQPLQVPVSIEVETTGAGNATAGVDYIALPKTRVTFAPGENHKRVLVYIRGDVKRESDEVLVLKLSNPVGGIIYDGTALGTIREDDLPRIQFQHHGQANVEGGDGMLLVVMDAPSPVPVTFSLSTVPGGTAIEGQDYPVPSQVYTLAVGETFKYIYLPTTKDDVADGTEYFHLTFKNLQGANPGTDSIGTVTMWE